jgi:hypothetical protein
VAVRLNVTGPVVAAPKMERQKMDQLFGRMERKQTNYENYKQNMKKNIFIFL